MKKFLNNVLQAEFGPIRERRKAWEARLPDVRRAMQIDSIESLLK